MEDDWLLLPSSADAPRDDAPDPDPDLIRTLEANRAGWLSRRCKSAHWGIFRLDHAAEFPAADGDEKTRGRYAVRCSICGTRYAVDPHVGGSFLKRHVTGKHPGAWTWWSARCTALDLAERTHRRGPRVAAGHDDDDEEDDGDGDEKDVSTMKRRPPRSSARSAGVTNPGDKRARIGGEEPAEAEAHPPPTFASSRRGVDGVNSRDANPGSRGTAGSGDAAGVAAMCEDCEPCELRPRAFFVAWSGVMTLAWEGFPPAIASLKRRIARAFPALPPEKPGSRWAKTTLGCLKEGARLTPAELGSLVDLCERFGERFGKIAATPREGAEGVVEGVTAEASPSSASPGCVPVDCLSVVLFQCRSLERVLSEHVVSFRDGIIRNRDRPSRDETAVVDAVLRESSRECLGRYWPLASRDGGREPHYRDDKFGATLVARLKKPPAAVAEFRAAVDAALPGMYAWFHDDSLHVTLRGLVDPP